MNSNKNIKVVRAFSSNSEKVLKDLEKIRIKNQSKAMSSPSNSINENLKLSRAGLFGEKAMELSEALSNLFSKKSIQEVASNVIHLFDKVEIAIADSMEKLDLPQAKRDDRFKLPDLSEYNSQGRTQETSQMLFPMKKNIYNKSLQLLICDSNSAAEGLKAQIKSDPFLARYNELSGILSVREGTLNKARESVKSFMSGKNKIEIVVPNSLKANKEFIARAKGVFDGLAEDVVFMSEDIYTGLNSPKAGRVSKKIISNLKDIKKSIKAKVDDRQQRLEITEYIDKAIEQESIRPSENELKNAETKILSLSFDKGKISTKNLKSRIVGLSFYRPLESPEKRLEKTKMMASLKLERSISKGLIKVAKYKENEKRFKAINEELKAGRDKSKAFEILSGIYDKIVARSAKGLDKEFLIAEKLLGIDSRKVSQGEQLSGNQFLNMKSSYKIEQQLLDEYVRKPDERNEIRENLRIIEKIKQMNLKSLNPKILDNLVRESEKSNYDGLRKLNVEINMIRLEKEQVLNEGDKLAKALAQDFKQQEKSYKKFELNVLVSNNSVEVKQRAINILKLKPSKSELSELSKIIESTIDASYKKEAINRFQEKLEKYKKLGRGDMGRG